MRIIAGAAKGRRLVSPPGGATRPLTGRAKEAVFSSLGPRVVDADVVDLYAGTGSIGLEALSRGAHRVVFVEKSRPALDALRRNVAAVDLGGDIVAEDVATFLARSPDVFDLAFVDPPYALPLASLATILERLVPLLTDSATVVVHRRYGGETPALPSGLVQTDRRRYGDAELWRFEKESA
jgi:16S rRNA (guanine966-N2)-methyltransferase